MSYHPNLYRNGIDTSGILLLEYPDFICQCTGAKDCAAPGSVQLVGDAGRILIEPGSSNCKKLRLDRPGQETFSRECDESPWYLRSGGHRHDPGRSRTMMPAIEALEKTRQVVVGPRGRPAGRTAGLLKNQPQMTNSLAFLLLPN